MFLRLSGLVIFHVLFIGTLSSATAQQFPYNVDTKPPRGLLPTSDQLVSPVDSVDTVNGKLHLQIPVGSLPPGPAGTGFDVELVYDSHLYDLYVHEIQPLYTNPPPVVVQELQAAGSTGGWTYNFQNFRLEGETRFDLDVQCPTNGPLRVHRYHLGLPDGSQHILHLKGYSDELPSDQYDGEGWFGIQADGKPPMAGNPPTPLQCWTNVGWLASGQLTYFTTDGSYLKLEIDTTPYGYWWNKTWTLYFPDGRRAQGKGSKLDALYDANSNKIVFENTCADSQCWQPITRIYHEPDAAASRDARKVVLAFNTSGANPNDPNVTVRTDTVTGPGPNGPVTSTVHWQRLVVGNDGRRYHWGGASKQELTDLAMVHWVVGDVQLPPAETGASSLTYQFSYSANIPAPGGYGELRSMTTPSGATYTYTYRFDGATCVDAAHCPTSADLAHYNWITQRRITGSDISTLTWNYEYDHTTYFKTTVHNPDGGDVVHWFTSPAGWGGVKLVTRIDEPHGSVRQRVWAQNKAYPLIGSDINNPNNPYIQRELVTVGNAANAPTSTAVTDFVYDKNGNLLSKTEYDWIDYPNESPQIVRRRTISNYVVNVGQASATANDVNAYWREHNPVVWGDPTSTRRLNAVRRREVWDGATIAAATEYEYDAPYTKGNAKKEYQWDSAKTVVTNPLTTGNSVVFERSYDPSGNVVEIFEPAVRTHIEYNNGNVPRYVFYAYQTPSQRRWEYTWNSSGPVVIGTVITAKIDLDNGIATGFAYDDLGRQKLLTEGTNLRRTATTYDDASRRVTVLRDLVSLGDGKLQTISYYDQLGRVKTVQQSDGYPLSGPTDGIKVTTTYLAPVGSGRWVITSSPYRTTNDPTLEWTCTQYDRLERITAVAMFTGSVPPPDCATSVNRTGVTISNYNAAWTTVTDPALNVRNLRRDALGRTDEVLEYPNAGVTYTTQYAYDVLNNLTKVCQNGTFVNGCLGGQVRTFLYTSLGRLRSAANPETNNIAATYTYFDSGDLKTRTDPRGLVTTFEYDELHRLKSKTYTSDPQSTPKATYAYYLAGADAPPNIGLLKSATAATSTTPSTTIAFTQYAYDLLGRVNASTQSIDGYPGTLSLTYTYKLNDGLATVGYPSGHVVNYSVDDAGRPVRVYTSSKIYADLTPINPPDERYTADGRLARMWLGNDLWETRDYRTPAATTTLNVGTTDSSNNILGLEYNYHPTQNNGNLRSHGIIQPGRIWKQSYDYDGVNRVKCAAEALTTAPADPCAQGTWRQTFGYDAYGNRWVASTTGLTGVDPHEPTVQSNFDAATNRLYVNNSSYDAAGNQTRYEPWNLSYDAENRIKSVVTTPNGSVGTGTFVYDADGRRVKKAWTVGTTTQTTYYLYNAFGQLAAEYSTQPAVSTSTAYIHSDLLGSVRMVTGERPPIGTAPVLECYDYVPFGRMLNSSDDARNTGCYPANPDTQISSRLAEKFTAKQRDSETRLDYFGARYYSAAEGRYLSPDWSENPRPVPYADLRQPQTLNLYAYVGNNPLVRADVDGHCWPWCTAGAGAAIGGATGVASELIAARISHRQVKLNDLTAALLKGVVSGAVAGVVGPQAAGLGLGVQALAVGEASVVGGFIGRGIRDQGLDDVFNPSAAIIDFASGAAGIKLGSLARSAGTKLAQRSAEVAAASGDQESVIFLTGNARLAGELTRQAESLTKSTVEKVAKSKLREKDKENCVSTGTCDPE